jgi:MFS family permease
MKNGQEPTDSLLQAANGNGDDATQKANYASVSSHLKDPLIVQHSASDNSDPEDWESLKDEHAEDILPLFTIVSILSTAFSYGCILTTLFLITLPIECTRINKEHADIPKSVALGNFVAIAGLTQLISPLVGRLSDTYVPPAPHEIGQRLPYLLVGSVCTVTGLLLQMMASYRNFWIRYSFAFFLHMIGLNIQYSMMITLIPDQVPASQTGVANGILALLLVTGSLFGFGLFHSFLGESSKNSVQNMYGLYTCIVIVSSILTGTHAHDRDAELAYLRTERRRRRSHSLSSGEGVGDLERRQYTIGQRIRYKARQIVLTPTLIMKSILVDPLRKLDRQTLLSSYTIDIEKHHDFFIVTVSRLFYYCGMSVQVFFLYFLKDILAVDNPERAVASLAILGQISGAITCYPVGLISDRLLGGRRKPFVYLACITLSTVTLSLIFVTNLDEMAILSLILGAANGIYLTMDTSLAVDTLPKDLSEEDDEDGNGSAQLLGIWGVAAFLGSALGPMIGGPLLYIFGQQPQIDSQLSPTDGGEPVEEEYTLTGYAVVIALSSFYFMCSALSLRYIKDRHE